MHNNFGVALLENGDTEGAKAELEAALRIDPESANTHNNLGNVFLPGMNLKRLPVNTARL
jgi:Tfp pilus assembly protein PilF